MEIFILGFVLFAFVVENDLFCATALIIIFLFFFLTLFISSCPLCWSVLLILGPLWGGEGGYWYDHWDLICHIFWYVGVMYCAGYCLRHCWRKIKRIFLPPHQVILAKNCTLQHCFLVLVFMVFNIFVGTILWNTLYLNVFLVFISLFLLFLVLVFLNLGSKPFLYPLVCFCPDHLRLPLSTHSDMFWRYPWLIVLRIFLG